jgi:hypothetical protein
MEISREDVTWLLNDYNKIRGYGKVASWIDWHLRAMSIFRGQPVAKPSCSCEFGAYSRMANSMFEQNLPTLEELNTKYNTPVTE